MLLVESLLPAGFSGIAALGLVLAAFLTAAMTAALGIGGGVALLAIMTQLVPVAVLIPVHGVVQLGANFSRALIQARYAQWRLIAYFLGGCIVGAIAGGQIFFALPESFILAAVALFILWSVWGNLPPLRGKGQWLLVVGGAGATVLTMFVGATGPFVLALLRRFDLNKTALVGTHAVAMVLQHGLKVVVFGALGFAFGAWLPLMLAMVAAGFVGTLAGTGLLHRLPEEGFRLGLKIVMTLIALELLVEVLLDLVA